MSKMENPALISSGGNASPTNYPAQDITIRYFTPSADLIHFVKYYWIIQVTDTTKLDRVAKISPSGYPELIFHFGDSVSIVTPTGNFPYDSTASIVAGQITKPVYVNLNKHLSCLCVKLQPYSLGSLFRIKSSELTDKATNMNDINPKIQKEIYYELSEAKNDNLKITIVENHLRKLLSRNDNNFCPVTYSVIDYFKNHNMKISELCQKLNLNSRYLQRKFTNDIGMSPKMLYRIIRFNKAYNQIKYNRNATLQDVTFCLGYYDLSHLISEFREFTGLSPLSYFKKENVFNGFFAGIH